jgi:hypothetical protein
MISDYCIGVLLIFDSPAERRITFDPDGDRLKLAEYRLNKGPIPGFKQFQATL